MKLEPDFIEFLMDAALRQAIEALEQGEVPVGAVVARGQEILAVAHNEIESACDATLHAEILAIRRASLKTGDWRLSDALLCVTLEPCTMCAGAIRAARLPVVIFGARDEKLGACGSRFDLLQDPRLGPVPRVICDVKSRLCADLLVRFFKAAREKGAV